MEQLETNRVWLRAQMQGYAASRGPGHPRASSATASATSSRTSAASPGPTGPSVWQFFATGMLLNVLSSMQVHDNPEPWMSELLAGCGKDL